MKSKKGLFLTLLMLLFFVPMAVIAQFPPDPGGDPDDPLPVPLDGGISLLVAAGVGYGVKRANDARKQKANS